MAVGSATLELVLKWRDELWPDVPVVFTMVDEADVGRLKPPPDVTGTPSRETRRYRHAAAARAVVPDLESVCPGRRLVGPPGRLSQLEE